MDAVMKLLQDLERQQNAPVIKPEKGEKRRRKKQQQGEAPPPPAREEAVALPPPAQTPAPRAETEGWSRQRLLDAFRIAQALGPPPGLDDL